MSRPSVLVVDDERLVRWAIREELTERCYDVREAANGQEARTLFDGSDAVVLDYSLPDVDGLALLREMGARLPRVPVVMLTGHGSIEHAVEAMRAGAWHYVHKPIGADELCDLVHQAVQANGPPPALDAGDLPGVVGQSPAMAEVKRIARRAASSPVTVLLRGESGTGKDVMARAMHEVGARRNRPFIHVTCSAVPESLLESELFGHEAGAFTGAQGQRRGVVEQADGGTLFLDEIGELSPVLQAKLLRLLEDRTIRRVGGHEELRLDVRLMAATHVDLEAAVRAGRFREDLYYRLAVLELILPPLRDRRSDIPALVGHFLRRLGREDVAVEPRALERLVSHRWPGNVRELRNEIERALVLAPHPVLRAQDLSLRSRLHAPGSGDELVLNLPEDGLDLQELERELLRQALERSGGNRTRAAELLRLSRDAVRYRIAKYGWK